MDSNEIINLLTKLNTKLNLIEQEKYALNDQQLLNDCKDLCQEYIKIARKELKTAAPDFSSKDFTPQSKPSYEVTQISVDSQDTVKLMIIDDDQDTHKVLTFFLKNQGFEVFSFQNPLEGIEKLKEIKPQLLLLDIMMPEMNGFEVLKKIKDDPELKNIKVIVASSLNYDKDKVEALRLGAFDFIAKPYDPSELLIRLNNLTKQ